MTEYKRANGETILLSKMSTPHLQRTLAALRRDPVPDQAHLIPAIEQELKNRNDFPHSR